MLLSMPTEYHLQLYSAYNIMHNIFLYFYLSIYKILHLRIVLLLIFYCHISLFYYLDNKLCVNLNSIVLILAN